jgi:DoxX-like family
MTVRTLTATSAAFTESYPTEISNTRRWAGRLLSGAAVLFFLVDGGMKLFKPPVVVESTVRLGYPESAIVGIGLTLLACTALYLLPRTAVLGALLLTGYLGGAVATHVRVSGSWFNLLFPVVLGTVVWAGLSLRDPWLATLLTHDRASR